VLIDCFFKELLNEICSENPDAVGDLYLDIAEAYMNVGLYMSAKPILFSLVTSAKYNMVCVVCFFYVFSSELKLYLRDAV